MYVNNVTADTFSHVSNTQTEKANAIFTSEKLDKYDELIDAVKNLTINDTKYYESNTIESSSTTLRIAYRIFALDNGILLRSL